jgi:hypothetical protein
MPSEATTQEIPESVAAELEKLEQETGIEVHKFWRFSDLTVTNILLGGRCKWTTRVG